MSRETGRWINLAYNNLKNSKIALILDKKCLWARNRLDTVKADSEEEQRCGFTLEFLKFILHVIISRILIKRI